MRVSSVSLIGIAISLVVGWSVSACGNDRGVVCGDGHCLAGYTCVQVGGTARCQQAGSSVCGNGIIEGTEECDEGDVVGGDGCDEDCLLEYCGNGRDDAGETCDDGNQVSGDGCSAACKQEVCGDGVADVGEECDCGDSGIVSMDSQCRDQPNSATAGVCRVDCQRHCGDGQVLEHEACDTAVPSVAACVDLGFDLGHLRCAAGCDSLVQSDCGYLNWRPMPLSGAVPIYDVWASGPGDVYAVGYSTNGGGIYHYQGVFLGRDYAAQCDRRVPWHMGDQPYRVVRGRAIAHRWSRAAL